jgi:RNA polymerase sigma-70 factor (ECF subfamily)
MNDDHDDLRPAPQVPSSQPGVAPASPQLGPPDLVDRLVACDPAAFEELVRRHGPRMLCVARRYLPRRSDAEDALQDSFVHVVRHIAGFRRACALETWLHRVVVNCALTSLRRTGRTVAATPEVSVLERAPRLGGRAPPPSAHDTLARDETRSALAAGLALLPASQRALLLLRDVDALEITSIAELLAIRVPTVRVRLHRARRALRRVLRPGMEGLLG